MERIITIAALCIITVFLSAVLRRYKEEHAFFLLLAAAVMVFGAALSIASPVFTQLRELFEAAEGAAYFTLLLKALGVCYITRFAAAFCRDSGHTLLSEKIELCGRCAVLLLCLPLIRSIVEFTVTLVR